MAYPVLKYNSSTGSDTNPSDCAASSVTESATASGSAGGTTITFSSSVDLSACADDDSDWMWCETTAAGIHLFRITAFTGGLSTCTSVTVEPAITADFSGAYWHVNGTRQSLDADNSSAFGLDGNQWRRGWTVELDGTFVGTAGLNLCERESTAGAVGDPHFVMRASPSATTKPIIRSTASTWPCGRDRVVRKASSAETNSSPRRLRRMMSMSLSGRCEILPSVSWSTFLPSR